MISNRGVSRNHIRFGDMKKSLLVVLIYIAITKFGKWMIAVVVNTIIICIVITIDFLMIRMLLNLKNDDNGDDDGDGDDVSDDLDGNTGNNNNIDINNTRKISCWYYSLWC